MYLAETNQRGLFTEPLRARGGAEPEDPAEGLAQAQQERFLDRESSGGEGAAIAEVTWTKASSTEAGYDIGVKFINVYGDDLDTLKKYLASIGGHV